MELLFLKEWPEDTNIEWWNRGRKILNAAIRDFNEWGLADRPLDGIAAVERRLEWAYQQLKDVDGGSDWVEKVQEMRT